MLSKIRIFPEEKVAAEVSLSEEDRGILAFSPIIQKTPEIPKTQENEPKPTFEPTLEAHSAILSDFQTPTHIPTPIISENDWKEVVAIMSNYYPPWGGVNCNENCDDIATGELWRDFEPNTILACPSEFPIGTLFDIEGEIWECRDRGGLIVTEQDGSVWLDLLTNNSQYKYKEKIMVKYLLP